MTLQPAQDTPLEAAVPAQAAAPGLEETDAPVGTPATGRYADPWHLHTQACYWDVRTCGWVCP